MNTRIVFLYLFQKLSLSLSLSLSLYLMQPSNGITSTSGFPLGSFFLLRSAHRPLCSLLFVSRSVMPPQATRATSLPIRAVMYGETKFEHYVHERPNTQI